MRRLSTPALLAAILALSGCHLIFRYEDRPDSGVPVPDLPARSEVGPADQGPDLEVKLDQPGPRWTTLSPPLGTTYGLWGKSASEVYLVGGNGAIVRYGGGAQFTTLKTATTNAFYAVTPLGSIQFMAVGLGNTVRICSRDTLLCALADPTGGDVTKYHWLGVWCSSSDTCYLGGYVGTEGGLFKSSGGSWTAICGSLATKPIRGVSGVSDSQVYAVDSAGRVLRYSGAGGCKLVHTSSTAGALGALWASSTVVLAAGQHKTSTGISGKAAGVWISNGKAAELKLDAYPVMRAVYGVSNKDMVLAGDDGTALGFDGAIFTDLKPPTVSGKKTNLWSAWISPGGDIFMGGPSGVLLHYR